MPSPEQQARFFTNLQLLLTEGEFVSTYKFALLIALVRWAVENPDHDEAQPLDVAELAPHFVELYWPQVQPFRVAGIQREVAPTQTSPGPPADSLWEGVLVQERGGQVLKVLKLILAEQQRGHTRIDDLPVISSARLRNQIKQTIREMPLWRLHAVGGEELRFLYRGDGDHWLYFEPGIVACLASFALLVENIVRSAWLRFVLGCNPNLLGAASQIEAFLFPSGRAGLAVWRPVLEEVHGSRCFYCEQTITRDADVDHFLPWSRYPRDLGHNFVLAHAACNQRKKDHLASCDHLASWCKRNETHTELFARRFDDAGLPHSWPTLKRVASTLYHNAATAKASVWHVGNKELVPLTDEWRRILGCA
jgi:hypothetical protein